MSTNQRNESLVKFVYFSLLGGAGSIAITKIAEGIRLILGIPATFITASLIGFASVTIATAFFVVLVRTKRHFLYGISIAYAHGLISGLIFNREAYLKSLEVLPVFTLLIAPLVLIVFGLIGAYIGKRFQKTLQVI